MGKGRPVLKAFCIGVAVALLLGGIILSRGPLQEYTATRDTIREWTQAYDVLNALMEVSEAVKKSRSREITEAEGE